MAERKLRVVHYVNQFFGQQGGEDKADLGFMVKSGPVGPGMALQKAWGERAEVVATLICGDNTFAKNPDVTAQEGLKLIEPYHPDLFFAGPAFAAGRYGVACGALCKVIGEKLGIPVVTGMYEENPGVDLYRKNAFICKTGNSARNMVECIANMTKLASKLISGEGGTHLVCRQNLPRPEEYNYFSRNLLRNEYCEKSIAQRSVEKLLAKVQGKPFESEVTPQKFERVPVPPPIKDPSKCGIALVTDGGLVPKGNPDRLATRSCLKWGGYDIEEVFREYEVAHAGYFNDHVLERPDRLVPVDAMRDLVEEGKIGKLNRTFFSTCGNSTVAKRCAEMGDEIADQMRKEGGVDAVILTST